MKVMPAKENCSASPATSPVAPATSAEADAPCAWAKRLVAHHDAAIGSGGCVVRRQQEGEPVGILHVAAGEQLGAANLHQGGGVGPIDVLERNHRGFAGGELGCFALVVRHLGKGVHGAVAVVHHGDVHGVHGVVVCHAAGIAPHLRYRVGVGFACVGLVEGKAAQLVHYHRLPVRHCPAG